MTWPWRRLQGLWMYWGADKLFGRRISRWRADTQAILRFDGSEYMLEKAGGRILIRVWPSRKTMLNPLWWCSCSGQFAWRWLVTRPYLPLLLAAPAVSVVLGVLTAISAGAKLSPATQANVYKRLFAVSLQEKEYAPARLASDALIRLYPNRLELIYDRGLVEQAAGNLAAARQVMVELARGFESQPAALWLAQQLGEATAFDKLSQAEKSDYLGWLRLAAQYAPENPLPRRMLADALSLIGDRAGARLQLLPLADSDPEVSYVVLYIEQELGLTVEAQERAEKLVAIYVNRLKEEPRDVTARVRYSRVLLLQEQEVQAIKLLEEGAVLSPQPEEMRLLRGAVTEALVAHAAKIKRDDPSPRGLMNSLSRLKRAMAIDPTNPRLIDAITEASVAAAESKNNEMYILREAVVRAVEPDTAHFILGTIALNQGKMAEATQHLEIAAKSNPNLPGLLNNLAHAISHNVDGDLERALRLSTAAVTSLPDHPYLRETRGQILLKLERYTEAIADLEIALVAPELRTGVREGLARAYEASGQTEIAQRQRELMQRNQ